MVEDEDGELRVDRDAGPGVDAGGIEVRARAGNRPPPRARSRLLAPTEQESVRFAGAAAVTAAAAYLLMVALTTQAESIRASTPWRNDPYDAIASIGGQIVAAVAVITLIRLVRYRDTSGMPRSGMRYVLRGGWIIVGIAIASGAADCVAWATSSGGLPPHGSPAAARAAEVALLVSFAVALASTYWMALGQAAAWTRRAREGEGEGRAADDVFGDAAVLVRRGLAWTSSTSPVIGSRASRAWNAALRTSPRLGFVGPREHPWRFATAVGAIAGIGLAAAHAVEEPVRGGDPIARVLLVTVAFVLIETAAVVSSFWALRRFLGIALPGGGRFEASETA